MIAEIQIKAEQIKMGYPRSEDIVIKEKKDDIKKIPLGEIDYSDLKGYKRYHLACKLYWEKRLRGYSYITMSKKTGINPTTIRQLCSDFHKEVNKPIRIYEDKINPTRGAKID